MTIVEGLESGDCDGLIGLAEEDEHVGVRNRALALLFRNYPDREHVIATAHQYLENADPIVAGLAALTVGAPGFERVLELAASGALVALASPERVGHAVSDAFIGNPTQPRGTLTNILTDPRNRPLVVPVASRLGASGLDSALDVLLAVAKQIPDPEGLAAVLDAIAALSGPRAEAQVSDLLTSGHYEGGLLVRMLEILRRVGGRESVPILRALEKRVFEGDREDEAIAAALAAIRARLDGEEGGLAISGGIWTGGFQ